MRRPFATLTTLALALGTATLVACQDVASTTGLTDPEVQFAKGGNGGGGGKPGGGGGKPGGGGGASGVLITATGGLVSVDQPGTVDSKKGQISVEASAAITLDVNYVDTRLAFDGGACAEQTGRPRTGLEDFLTVAGPPTVLGVHFDPSGTDGNRILAIPPGGVRVMLNTFQDELPSSTPLTAVFADSDDGDAVTGTYTYSGGAILLEDFTQGPPKDYPRLYCPNTDVVVITLTRP